MSNKARASEAGIIACASFVRDAQTGKESTSMALLSLRGVTIGFGGHPVLENIDLQIESGERLGLVGRNGAGKSTLLKLVAAQLQPESGVIARERGVRVAYLPQEAPGDLTGSVADVIAANLRERGAAGTEDDAWRDRLLLDTILARAGLDPTWQVADLSAGLKRRVMLARELAPDPD